MTEAEWLGNTDPRAVLKFFQGRSSERKLRLFACACCYRLSTLIIDERVKNTLLIAEQFADGLVSDQERSNARKVAQQASESKFVTSKPKLPKEKRRAVAAVYYAAARDAFEAAYNASDLAVDALIWNAGGHNHCDWRAIQQSEHSCQMSTIRCIFGNPFRPVSIESAWLAPNVVALAQAIYNERAFDRLPELANALVVVGCEDKQILGHCRSEGPHVRGCWVVDLMLGKE